MLPMHHKLHIYSRLLIYHFDRTQCILARVLPASVHSIRQFPELYSDEISHKRVFLKHDEKSSGSFHWADSSVHLQNILHIQSPYTDRSRNFSETTGSDLYENPQPHLCRMLCSEAVNMHVHHLYKEG